VLAEGLAIGADQKNAALDKAAVEIAALAA
jgi:hypothetical protein